MSFERRDYLGQFRSQQDIKKMKKTILKYSLIGGGVLLSVVIIILLTKKRKK